MAYKEDGNQEDYLSNLKTAKAKYQSGSKMFDPYIEPMDKIYLEDIENEFKMAFQNMK